MRADPITLPLYMPVATGSPPLWRRSVRLLLLLALAALYGIGMAYLPQQLIVLPMIPIMLLLLLALWLLPDQATFPDRALMISFTWFLALYYLWPSYIAIALPGLPWFSAGRLALLVLLVIALYCLSTSSVFRREMLASAQASRVIWTLLLIEFATQAAPILVNSAPLTGATRFTNDEIYWAAPFFIGCYIFGRPGRIEYFIRTMILIAVTLSVFGFLEHSQHRLFWAGHIPAFLKVDNDQMLDIVFSAQMRDYVGIYRVHSTFTVSLIYAELLVLVLPFVLHGIVTAETFKRRMLMIGAWLLICPNIMYTDTRLGKIGFIIAHLGYALLWALRSRRRNANFLSTAIIFAIPTIAAVVLGVIFASHTLHAMVFGSEGYAGSNDARFNQVSMGIPKILRNPMGYGAGTGGMVLGFRSPGGQLTIDSQYLKTAIEFGVLGLLATYAVFIWSGWLALKMYFQSSDRESELAGPLALLFINYVFIKGVLAEDYNNTLGYIAVAVVVALWARYQGPEKPLAGSGVLQRLSGASPQ